MKIQATNQEIASMMKLIDKENKGYLAFPEFSKVFTPSMSTTLVDVPLNENYYPHSHTQPSKELYDQNLKTTNSFFDKFQTFRTKFKPDMDSSKFQSFDLTV